MSADFDYKVCSCEDWKRDMPWLDSCQWLASMHGQKFKGKVFNYCPWCGKLLEGRKHED